MRKGKELEFHEGPGGLESASRILMKGSRIREADSDDRGFPLDKQRDRHFIGNNGIIEELQLRYDSIIHREPRKIITVSPRNIMMGNGKELEFPEGRGSASRILMKGSGIRFVTRRLLF